MLDFDPQILVRQEKDGQLTIMDDGMNLLEEFSPSFKVIVFMGMSAEQRHDSIETILAEEGQEIKLAPFDPSLEGIVYLGCKDCEETGETFIFLDVSEGFHSEDRVHPKGVLYLGALLSSCFVYFHEGDFCRLSWEKLQPLADLVDGLRMDMQDIEDQDTMKDLFPSLCWILQDSLSHKLNLGEDLEKSLLHVQSIGVFPRKQNSTFNDPMNTNIRQALFSKVQKKRMFHHALNGKQLVSLVKSYIFNINNLILPDVHGAWNDIVDCHCKSVAQEALTTYQDCILAAVEEYPPMSLERFSQDNEQLFRIAIDMFHSGAIYKGERRRRIKLDLQDAMAKFFQEQIHLLSCKSREYCNEIRSFLIKEYFEENSQLNSFTEFKDCMEKFRLDYFAKASGPEINSVLVETIFDDLMQQFEKITMKCLHGEALEVEIQRMESQYEARRMELVQQIEQERGKLKESITQEKEMFQKLASATQARYKRGESDVQRVRQDLVETKSKLSEMEERNIILQQSNKDLQQRCDDLEQRVIRLTESWNEEQKLREDVHGVLAETILSAETKEQELNEQLAKAHSKLSHIEEDNKAELLSKLQSLTKATEEKEELQKRLNDFFLRVTALPVSVQKDFFCIPGNKDGDIIFADSLTSYMS